MTTLVALSLLSVTVAAPLTPAATRRLARAKAGEIQECYDTWTATLTDKPKTSSLQVDLRVRKSGRPESIEPAEFAGTPFADCVVARIRRWRFPRHTSPGATAPARLNFDLAPPLQVVRPQPVRQALGKLSPEAIRWVVASHNPDVQGCFERWLEGLERSPGEIKLRLSLEILADGRPVGIEQDVLAKTPLAQCVREQVATWRFPSHEGPEAIAVVVPLRLVPRRPEAEGQAAATPVPPSEAPPVLRPPRGVPPLGQPTTSGPP